MMEGYKGGSDVPEGVLLGLSEGAWVTTVPGPLNAVLE